MQSIEFIPGRLRINTFISVSKRYFIKDVLGASCKGNHLKIIELKGFVYTVDALLYQLYYKRNIYSPSLNYN